MIGSTSWGSSESDWTLLHLTGSPRTDQPSLLICCLLLEGVLVSSLDSPSSVALKSCISYSNLSLNLLERWNKEFYLKAICTAWIKEIGHFIYFAEKISINRRMLGRQILILKICFLHFPVSEVRVEIYRITHSYLSSKLDN